MEREREMEQWRAAKMVEEKEGTHLEAVRESKSYSQQD